MTAKRAIKHLKLNYKINNGKTKTANVSEWRGGERYGHENNPYYAEFRGEVKGARAGDKVKVWFSGEKKRRVARRRRRVGAVHLHGQEAWARRCS